jgi:hypothetical protein
MRWMPALAGLLTCLVGSVTYAGECVNDWPNPPSCFPDILCPEFAPYWDWRRSIVHLYGPDIGGTGVLINNANCYIHGIDCGAPYLLTANHIVSYGIGHALTPGQKVDIQTLTTFTFGFEAAVCNGPAATGAVAVGGAEIVAESPSKDLLLLKLSTTLPRELGAYYVGWCGGPLEQAVVISHPCGAPKRVAVSDFGEISFMQTMTRTVYDVSWWQDGALASASSGAPLLDSTTGLLRGIFTDTTGAGSDACASLNAPAGDRFTASPSIIEFLPSVIRGGAGCIGHFDSNEGAPLLGTVENSKFYGPGESVKITATNEVHLVDGFSAAAGSVIRIEIEP